jgi:Polysaccharide deacetylase
VTELRLRGWRRAPRLGVVVPDEERPGWSEAALWCALLEAWGVPFERTSASAIGSHVWTTLVVPGPSVDPPLFDRIRALEDASVLLAGSPSETAARLDGPTRVVRFGTSPADLAPDTTEAVVDAAEEALAAAAPDGLLAIWRWPDEKDVALVVDGDVDHPTGVDPECSRYVAPAIETARRASFDTYGVFAAGANVDAEPASFPPGAEYYNHSHSHPYSHWNAAPWEALDREQMRDELTRCNAVFRERLGADDRGLFRLPHFQLEAWDRTADVLEDLGYRAESSIGANRSITGGLPFHPARRPWSDRTSDAAYARTHPDRSERRSFLQLPISTDPTDPGFPNGCCSYNTLDEGVRNRSADPEDFEVVLEQVLDRATTRRSLAHVFIDPPDAGFGRLPGDVPDYASAVERWMGRAARREDVAVMTTAELAAWWLARERAVDRLSCRLEGSTLLVDLPELPKGASISVLEPGGSGGWRRFAVPSEEGGGSDDCDPGDPGSHRTALPAGRG